MCEYCESKKPICNEVDKKVVVHNNTMLVQRKIGNVFDQVICNTTFRINYCPICGRKLGKEG